jgi:hypothetical protein
MLRNLLNIFIFIYPLVVFAQNDRFYYTKKGDNLERILEEYVDLELEEEERKHQVLTVKKNNPHITNWNKMKPGQRIDMLGIEKRQVRMVEIEDSPDMYIDQVLWRGSLWGSYADFTFTNKIQSFEVQAATSSNTNFGLSFEYSFSKSTEYSHWRGGFERHAFSYYTHQAFFLDIRREEYWENFTPYLTFQSRDLHFDTVNNQLIRDLSERTYRFIGVGNILRYYIWENLTYFKFDISALVQSSGTSNLDEKGLKVLLENEFVVHPNFSLSPYLEYMTISSQQPIRFALAGMKIIVNFDIL